VGGRSCARAATVTYAGIAAEVAWLVSGLGRAAVDVGRPGPKK
jgi:hypothetical protein